MAKEIKKHILSVYDENGNKIPIPAIGSKDYKLPAASENKLGGIKAPAKTPDQTVPVGIGEDNKLYVAPSGEEQVQSDWAENDPQSPAYVKNRFGGYKGATRVDNFESSPYCSINVSGPNTAGNLVYRAQIPCRAKDFAYKEPISISLEDSAGDVVFNRTVLFDKVCVSGGRELHYCGNAYLSPIRGELQNFPQLDLTDTGEDYFVWSIYPGSAYGAWRSPKLSVVDKSFTEYKTVIAKVTAYDTLPIPVQPEFLPKPIGEIMGSEGVSFNNNTSAILSDGVVIKSSTPGSVKFFKITITDDGAIKGTEFTWPTV